MRTRIIEVLRTLGAMDETALINRIGSYTKVAPALRHLLRRGICVKTGGVANDGTYTHNIALKE